MFNIFSRSIRTATRLNSWDAPDHWHRQHQDYLNRRESRRDRAVHLRAMSEENRRE
tara:strand:- start:201 stop:368 length:168 start_codon:yes stop_codon:yes gene_type:complete